MSKMRLFNPNSFSPPARYGLSHQALVLLLFLSGLTSLYAQPNYNIPLDHSYSLKNNTPFALEYDYHQIINSPGQHSFIYPRPCLSPYSSFQTFRDSALLQIRDKDGVSSLGIQVPFGFEYRYTDQSTNSIEGGLKIFGNKEALSFYLDARMFVELSRNPTDVAFDREFQENQSEEASGSIAYSSFSRYRANIDYDMAWGRVSIGRDAAHWGPGLFSNLVFHQDAIPFNQLTFRSRLGPFSIISLYGQLNIDNASAWPVLTDSTRSVYAHRYELNLFNNLVLGISEQMVLFEMESPFSFVPIVPLFIAKGNDAETNNNGNIAFDASFRLPGIGRIYSEFLIDDLQAPTALFDDFWANKWAWMAGIHLAGDTKGVQPGFIMEYSRIEPWVYTYYFGRTAQASHFGHPLGNQLGPNSQAIFAKLYLRQAETWYGSLLLELIWKGRDDGSLISHAPEDMYDGTGDLKKSFLKGVSKPEVYITPYGQYSWKFLTLMAKARIGENPEFSGRIQVRY